MDFDSLPYLEMTPYERKMWATLSAPPEELEVSGDKDGGSSLIHRARGRASGLLEGSGDRARDAWNQVPGNDRIEQQVARAIDGAFRAYLDLMARTIDAEKIRQSVGNAASEDLGALTDIRLLDLKFVHATMPKLGLRRATVAGIHGAAAGFVAGGATAAGATTGGMGALPSAGLFAASMTADAAGVVSSSLQSSGLISAYHGFPPVDGAGQYEVLKLQAAVMAAGGAKMTLLKKVQELAMSLAAKRAIAELNKQVLYRSLRHIFGWLTLNTAKRSIAKGVPVAGVVLGGGWNYGTLRRGIRSAEQFYDLRFLLDKYGDPSQLNDSAYAGPDSSLDDDAVGGVLQRLDEIETPEGEWGRSEARDETYDATDADRVVVHGVKTTSSIWRFGI